MSRSCSRARVLSGPNLFPFQVVVILDLFLPIFSPRKKCLCVSIYKNHLFAVRGFPDNARAILLLILLLNQIKKCMRVYDWMLFSSCYHAHNEMLLLLYPPTRSTITPKSTRALDPRRILTRSSLMRTATLRVLPVCLNFIEFCFFPLFFFLFHRTILKKLVLLACFLLEQNFLSL